MACHRDSLKRCQCGGRSFAHARSGKGTVFRGTEAHDTPRLDLARATTQGKIIQSAATRTMGAVAGLADQGHVET